MSCTKEALLPHINDHSILAEGPPSNYGVGNANNKEVNKISCDCHEGTLSIQPLQDECCSSDGEELCDAERHCSGQYEDDDGSDCEDKCDSEDVRCSTLSHTSSTEIPSIAQKPAVLMSATDMVKLAVESANLDGPLVRGLRKMQRDNASQLDCNEWIKIASIEMLFLFILGVTFTFSKIADVQGVSFVLYIIAFGLALGASIFSAVVSHKLLPIRNFFSAGLMDFTSAVFIVLSLMLSDNKSVNDSTTILVQCSISLGRSFLVYALRIVFYNFKWKIADQHETNLVTRLYKSKLKNIVKKEKKKQCRVDTPLDTIFEVDDSFLHRPSVADTGRAVSFIHGSVHDVEAQRQSVASFNFRSSVEHVAYSPDTHLIANTRDYP